MGGSCSTNRCLTNLTNYQDDGSVVVMTLNLYEAKTQLSSLVDKAAENGGLLEHGGICSLSGLPGGGTEPVRWLQLRRGR